MFIKTEEILDYLQVKQRERGGSDFTELKTGGGVLYGILYGDGLLFPEIKMRSLVKTLANREGTVVGEVEWVWRGETLVGAEIEVEHGG